MSPQPVDFHDTVEMTVRGGYDRFEAFPFVTGDLELSVRLGGQHVRPVLGASLYAISRSMRPQLPCGLPCTLPRWETLFPLHAGAIWQADGDRYRPYAGADLIAAEYMRDSEHRYWTTGGRLRGGVDATLID